MSDQSGQQERVPSAGLRIVGIGAAAGGIDAMRELFSTLGTKPDVAFVVVQHLDTGGADVPAMRTMTLPQDLSVLLEGDQK